jgi:SAM-dependent methyltransferase
MTTDQHYWDRIVEQERRCASSDLWWGYMRRVYTRLARAWFPAGVGRGLKTDLFEEAMSPHYPLADLGWDYIGVDISPGVVRTARERLVADGGRQGVVVGDLRALPFGSGSFDRILSGSSLDHFVDPEDLAASLTEVVRVLVDGGTLVLTLDNPHNPVLWLRARLPFGWLRRFGMVPYFVGETYTRAEGRRRLEALGMTVTHTTAVAHVPRILAVRASKWVERWGSPRVKFLFAKLLDRCERLERYGSRWWTGYYLAWRAEKRLRAVHST